MIYLIELLNRIKILSGFYPFHFILLIIIFICLIVMKKLYYLEFKNIDYKIYHQGINQLIVSVYIIIFILLIIYLRYIRWGFELELMPLYQKWLSFFVTVPFLFSVLFIEIIIIAILVLKKMKSYLNRSLAKQYIYSYFRAYNIVIKRLAAQKIDPSTIYLEREYPITMRVINKLSFFWSYNNVIQRIQWNYIMKPYLTLRKSEKIPVIEDTISRFILKYTPEIILFSLLLYEIYYYNYILHRIFYYLPFYFIYSLWKNISISLANRNRSFDFVIYERYYEEENVLYVNTTDEEDEILIGYIKRGFISYLKDLSPIVDEKEWNFMANFITVLQHKRRFVKDEKSGLYINHTTGEVCK